MKLLSHFNFFSCHGIQHAKMTLLVNFDDLIKEVSAGLSIIDLFLRFPSPVAVSHQIQQSLKRREINLHLTEAVVSKSCGLNN
jgi:hypothetical protein